MTAANNNGEDVRRAYSLFDDVDNGDLLNLFKSERLGTKGQGTPPDAAPTQAAATS
jgi:hypothetical protein